MNIYSFWAAAALFSLFASASWGQDTVEGALGGAITECSGAIAWGPEEEGGRVRVETLRIAALADGSGSAIAMYAAEQDFTPNDMFPCEAGFCTAQRVTETGVTSSVLQLRRGLDYGGGRVQYDLEAAFTIVSTGDGTMEVLSVAGRGGFVCNAELGSAFAAQAN